MWPPSIQSDDYSSVSTPYKEGKNSSSILSNMSDSQDRFDLNENYLLKFEQTEVSDQRKESYQEDGSGPSNHSPDPEVIPVNPPKDLPKLFWDLLTPLPGRKLKKLQFTCEICSEKIATWSSLITHNKTHDKPLCLYCGRRFSSPKEMFKHVLRHSDSPVRVTSKYGRARNVRFVFV